MACLKTFCQRFIYILEFLHEKVLLLSPYSILSTGCSSLYQHDIVWCLLANTKQRFDRTHVERFNAFQIICQP